MKRDGNRESSVCVRQVLASRGDAHACCELGREYGSTLRPFALAESTGVFRMASTGALQFTLEQSDLSCELCHDCCIAERNDLHEIEVSPTAVEASPGTA